MAGSPRDERTSHERLDYHNSSTEEVMKSTGYNEVMKSTGYNEKNMHRSNIYEKPLGQSKGRKHPAEFELENLEHSRRMRFQSMMHNNMHHNNVHHNNRGFLPMHLPDQNNDAQSPWMRETIPFDPPHARLPMNDMHFRYPSQQQQELSIENPHERQHQQQHQLQHQPLEYCDPPLYNLNKIKSPNKKSKSTKSSGRSSMIERAAQMRIEDPTISTEKSLILAGCSEVEAKDKKKQNNVRQKTFRLSMKKKSMTTDSETTQEVTESIKEEATTLEVKMDACLQKIEDRLDRKIDELGVCIDRKIDDIVRSIDISTSAHVESKRGSDHPNPSPKDADSG